LLAKVAVYQYGANPDAIVAFNELVEDLQGSPGQRRALETRLLQFLQSNATLAGKETAFKEIALIGTDASIPVLTPMLTRVETAEMARYALLSSLGQAPNDRIEIGMIDSLGHRRDAKAVPALAALAPGESRMIRARALTGLAAAEGKEAIPALRGPGVDAAIVSSIGSASGKVRVELIMAAGQRVMLDAADALIQAARDADPDARREALSAVRGALRLMVLPSDRTASASGRLLSETMALAQAAERDTAVANEAKVAVAQVTEALKLT
jgi:HEAT repeat protein